MFDEKTKINKPIYVGVIISFLIILVVDRHFAIPFIITEIFALNNLLKFKTNVIFEFFPFFLVIIGQLFFLIFGIKSVNKLKLILLLLSPLIISLGLILFSKTLTDYHRVPTIKTMIPFWIASLVFYSNYIWKVKNKNGLTE